MRDVTGLAAWALAVAIASSGGPARAQTPPADPTPPATSEPAPATPSPAAPPSPAPAAPTNGTAAPPNGTPATVLDLGEVDGVLGKNVRSTAGDDMGRIVDVMVGANGQVHAAIIDFGGFLGVGSRKVAVDWRALQFVADGKVGRVTTALSRNQIRLAPEYKSGEAVVVLGAPSANPPAAPQAAASPPPAPPPATPPAPAAAPSGSAAAPADDPGAPRPKTAP